MDEQFAYEKWWVTVGEEDRKLPPECLCPAAWNAAYSLGLAKGRKEGMELSASIAETGEGWRDKALDKIRLGELVATPNLIADAIRQAIKDSSA